MGGEGGREVRVVVERVDGDSLRSWRPPSRWVCLLLKQPNVGNKSKYVVGNDGDMFPVKRSPGKEKRGFAGRRIRFL